MIEPVLPMLATSAPPFDSGAYEFEVKWDGVRALAAVEGNRWRLWGRELADYGGRYPELEVLCRLPTASLVGRTGPLLPGAVSTLDAARPSAWRFLRGIAWRRKNVSPCSAIRHRQAC